MSDIYLQITETPTVVTLSAPVVSGALAATVTVANVVSVNVVTMPAITVQAAAPSVTTVAGTVTISSLPAISGTVTANVFGKSGTNDGTLYPIPVNESGNSDVLERNIPIGFIDSEGFSSIVKTDTPLPISGTVTVGSLPVNLSTTTIGGTARLNVTLSSATTIGATVPSYGNLYGGSDGTNLRAILVDSSGRTTVTGSVSILGTSSVTFSQIAGTVTMYGSNVNGGIVIPSLSDLSESPDARSGNALLVKIMDNVGNQNVPLTNTLLRATAVTIAGTVTANNPNGALTTRFGSVVTANTAQISTAVTNTSRKYLLAQNISTATVTIGIGFSPTTTQGIQLTAGAGLTFDSFVPTGAVYWLGATTGAAYTIIEG